MKLSFNEPFKAETHLYIYKTSILTAKKTPHFTVTKINWLTLFKEIIAVYCENRIYEDGTFAYSNLRFICIP
jgi:hypothetical protein